MIAQSSANHSDCRLPTVITFLCCLPFLAMTGPMGCRDNATLPEPESEPAVYATTLDTLASLYVWTLETMNREVLAQLLAPEFEFQFQPADRLELLLPTGYLNRTEELIVMGNIFTREPVTNWRGATGAAVTSLTISVFDPQGVWEPAPYPPDHYRRQFRITLDVVRPESHILTAEGLIELRAKEVVGERPDGTPSEHWLLTGLLDFTEPHPAGSNLQTASENFSLGWIKNSYFTNDPPTADFTVTTLEESESSFQFDASPCSDPDGGLNDRPYRWQFETDGTWTLWSSDSIQEHIYFTSGEKTVTLVVSDRWDFTDTTSQTVTAQFTIPFPDSEDQLMMNFKQAHTARNYEMYEQALHQNFKFVFLPSDVENLGLPCNYFPRTADLAAMANLLSGEPIQNSQGVQVSAVTQISFQVLDPVSAWEESGNPDFPASRKRLYNVHLALSRLADTTIIIQGQQEFYAASRDSLHEGTERPYWELVGQVELTSRSPRATEQASWGSTKYLYY